MFVLMKIWDVVVHVINNVSFEDYDPSLRNVENRTLTHSPLNSKYSVTIKIEITFNLILRHCPIQ